MLSYGGKRRDSLRPITRGTFFRVELSEPLPFPADAGFELIREIGRGGSGIVYAVRYRGEKVALKLPQADLGERDRAHFLREAALLKKAAHHGVVEVKDAGTLADGRPYLVMPLLDGASLAERLALRGRLPVREALALFLPLAEAVAHLHAMGLAHRDIKPENVFYLEEERRLLLLDFGIARETDKPPSTTTQANIVRGTPATMAPERFFGARATATSDVYELALVLYAMLAGALPWGESTDASERLSPKAPSELGVVVPPAIERAILEALSTRPERRPTVRALIARLSADGADGADGADASSGARTTVATRPPREKAEAEVASEDRAPKSETDGDLPSEEEALRLLSSAPAKRVTKASSIAPVDHTTGKKLATSPSRSSTLPIIGAVVAALGVGAIVARAWPTSSPADASDVARGAATTSAGDSAPGAPADAPRTSSPSASSPTATATALAIDATSARPPADASGSPAPSASASSSAHAARRASPAAGSACHQLALYDCAHNPTASKVACQGLADGTLDERYGVDEELNCKARLANLKQALAAPLPADAEAGLESCAKVRDVYCSQEVKRAADEVHHAAQALQYCSQGQSMYDGYKKLSGDARVAANDSCANMLPSLRSSLLAPFESMKALEAIGH